MSVPYTDNIFNKDVKNSQSESYLHYFRNSSISSVESEKSDNFREPSKSTQISKIDEYKYYDLPNTKKYNPGFENRNILIGKKSRIKNVYADLMSQYFLTLALCGLYLWVTTIWLQKTAISAFEKRLYNTIVTGVSIALGLNISSSFRDIALKTRWSILALGRQSLEEMNLLLQPESLMTVVKLATVSRRPFIIAGCIVWLLVNVITQSGLALLSFTYNFEIDTNSVQLKPGRAAIPRMDHFYPQTNHVVNGQSLRDEQYTAHTYGEFALNFGIGLVSSEPSPGKRYLPTDPLLWLDKSNSIVSFFFLDSPKDTLVIDPFSAFTERKISVNYKCDSFRVLSGGDGTVVEITVDRVGNVLLPQAVPDSTTFITRPNHTCPNDERCSVVEAFESSATDPWYYVCEISLGNVQNDPEDLSYVSDYLAQIATSTIAQIGYTDSRGYSSQVYPRESLWSQVAKGDAESIGMAMSIYAISSIAGAAQFNPFKGFFTAKAPSPGFVLILNHKTTFFTTLFLINAIHLLFVILATISSRKVKTGPSELTGMSLLMRPITDLLEIPFAKGEMNKYNDIIMHTYVRYEEDSNDKDQWKFGF